TGVSAIVRKASTTMKKQARLLTAAITLGALTALSGCGGSGGESEESANWRSATSVEGGGGMDALVEAAQAGGSLNVMGRFPDWADYGGLLAARSDTYDIEINNDTSTGASPDLINAEKNRQGQETSPDYHDTGEA